MTGAGMSQESGVPTFRDAQSGLWARYRPEELATPEAFRRNPDRVFGWYLMRWAMVSQTEPHAGHRALAKMERLFDSLSVVTQNVDGLHRRAGSSRVIELHGSLGSFRCSSDGHLFDDADLPVPGGESWEEWGPVAPPSCWCGSPVRPGVVWFGEVLPVGALTEAQRAVAEAEVVLVVGTSGVVYPAAQLPYLALSRGIPVIEINPEPTPLSEDANWRWPRAAGPALAELLEYLED